MQHPRTSWSPIATFGLPVLDAGEQTRVAELLWHVHEAIDTNEKIIDAGRQLQRAAMRALFTRGLRGEAQKETEIGPMPQSWEALTIFDLCNIHSGGTPRKSITVYWEGDIPWVSGKDLKKPALDETIDHLSPEGVTAGSRIVPADSVLVLVRGMGLSKDLPASVINRPMAFNQDIKALVPQDKFSGRFIRLGIYVGKERLLDKVVSSAHGMMTLNIKDVETFQIPCPPDPVEAEGIVVILDAIDRKADLHHHKHGVLDDLFEALLHRLMSGAIRVVDLDLSVPPKAIPQPKPADGQGEHICEARV